MNTMNLVISRLREGENLFSFNSLTDGRLKTMLSQLGTKGFLVRDNIEVSINLTNLEPNYYLQGSMSFTVDQSCARCAEVFPLPIQHNFQLALAHVQYGEGEKVSQSPEGEELDINYFDGNVIDLAPLIEEQFVLSIPYRALCTPQCKGICQKCGINLNRASCECAEDVSLKPFSQLKNFNIRK